MTVLDSLITALDTFKDVHDQQCPGMILMNRPFHDALCLDLMGENIGVTVNHFCDILVEIRPQHEPFTLLEVS